MTRKTNIWYFHNQNNIIVPATSENLITFLEDAGEKQSPLTKEQERETELRYLAQLNLKVKCYYDGHFNVIKFLQ